MKIANNVGRLREERGLSRPALGKLAGTSGQQIERLEKGQRKLTPEWIDRLAVAFGVPSLDVVAPTPRIALYEVPVIGSIACGNWKEAIADASQFIPCLTSCGPNAFALRADGDSMDRLVADGGYVIIDPDVADLIDGKVFAVMNGSGEATLKRYQAAGPRLTPCSTNPDHKPIEIGREPFTVIGQVIWTMGRP